MHTQLWFTSSFFKIEADEDQNTNPGRYGKSLAYWLSEQLKQYGVTVEDIVPEDFGWVIILSRKPFMLWIGCGNEDNSNSRWGIFTQAEPGFWYNLINKDKVKHSVAQLNKHIDEITKTIPDVSNIIWE